LTPIIAQNLEQWIHIDQDDLNKINICSLRSLGYLPRNFESL
jgi:hypothetical protein